MKKPTLSGQLLGWIFSALVLLWGIFIFVGYKTGEREADEFTDGHLAGVAVLLANLRGAEFVPARLTKVPAGLADLKGHEYQQSMNVIVWNSDGKLITRSVEEPIPLFSPEEGFATLTLGKPTASWRAYSVWNDAKDRKVMVLLSLQDRDALAQDIAGQIIEPGLWILPVLALALGLAVRRGLRPLYKLSKEIDALDIRKPGRLQTEYRHEEFRASVEAINALVTRYQESVSRERSLADEFAHELRTPLTSLALQVRTLRDGPEGPERAQALDRLEKDVLRAGEVIANLLALARASRAQMDDAVQTVDVSELARRLVGDFAQIAFETGHELSFLEGGPLQISGHPVLLGLALRNLLENAINHTPNGTRVEVQVLSTLGAIQVCDGPAAAASSTARGLADRPGQALGLGLGLGLGHRVVQKVADMHGVRFEKVTPPEGFSSCYRLSFPDDRPTETSK